MRDVWCQSQTHSSWVPFQIPSSSRRSWIDSPSGYLYICVWHVRHIFVLSFALWQFPINFQGFLARWNNLVRRMPTSSWPQKHHHHYWIMLFFTYSPYLFQNTLSYNHKPSLRRPLPRPSRSQDSLRPYQAAHSPSSPLLTMPSSNTSMPQKPPRRHSW